MRKIHLGAALAALTLAAPAAAQDTPQPGQPNQPSQPSPTGTPTTPSPTTPTTPTTPDTPSPTATPSTPSTPSGQAGSGMTIPSLQDDHTYAMHMAQHVRNGIALSDQILGVTKNNEVRQLARRIKADEQRQLTVLDRHATMTSGSGQVPQRGQRGAMAGRMGQGQGMGQGMKHGMGMGGAMNPNIQRGIERLRTATGVEADRLFLELMIVHHAGGLLINNAAQPNLTAQDLKRIASDGFDMQARQIGELQRVRQGMTSRSATR